jgi:hypothetical protein
MLSVLVMSPAQVWGLMCKRRVHFQNEFCYFEKKANECCNFNGNALETPAV